MSFTLDTLIVVKTQQVCPQLYFMGEKAGQKATYCFFKTADRASELQNRTFSPASRPA